MEKEELLSEIIHLFRSELGAVNPEEVLEQFIGPPKLPLEILADFGLEN